MIYLIDDKKSRQQDYGWNDLKLNHNKDVLKPIYTYDEMSDEAFRREIFSDNKVILMHESFFTNPNNELKKDFELIRSDIYNYAREYPESLIVFFSGSIASRKRDDNVAYMPVSIFYQNLQVFIDKIKSGDRKLEYLFFGKKNDIEKVLLEKLELADDALDELQKSTSQKVNLYVRPMSQFIQKPLEIFDDKFAPKDVEDSIMNQKIEKWLTEKKYDNIFIPLCFGPTLSDFNGLRLATLIRCTKTINQLSNIFIYAFVSMEYFHTNSYFNILKTKNVHLIDYKRIAFKESIERELKPLTKEELPQELNKLNLEVPKDYFDNHSIANEYGIYQLAYNAGIDIKEITDFDAEKLNSIYFKWLVAKNGLTEDLPEDIQEENKKFRLKLKGLTIKGKIDLTKFKR
jgi:hypothetical protein